jgi:hypothetical protein
VTPYLFPLLILRRHTLYRPRLLMMGAGAAAVLTLWPVGPAPPQIDAGFATIGLLDRALHAALRSPLAIQIAWSAMRIFGFPVLCVAALDVVRWRALSDVEGRPF